MTRTAEPVAPNRVRLSGVVVSGGYLRSPLLVRTPSTPESGSGASGGSGFDAIPAPNISYQLQLATFQVKYMVDNCAVGIPLSLARYNEDSNYDVMVERLEAGSPPITGTFDLSFNGRTIRGIRSDVSKNDLDALLEQNYPEEGGKDGEREGRREGGRSEGGREGRREGGR